MNSATQSLALPGTGTRISLWRRSTRQLLQLVRTWHQRARQRRQLLTLPPEMLKDIGISRADAVREGGKSFWQD